MTNSPKDPDEGELETPFVDNEIIWEQESTLAPTQQLESPFLDGSGCSELQSFEDENSIDWINQEEDLEPEFIMESESSIDQIIQEEDLESELMMEGESSIDQIIQEEEEDLESELIIEDESSIDCIIQEEEDYEEEDLASELITEDESSYGASGTKEKTKWYQAILKHSLGHNSLILDGNHNNVATRKALKYFQNQRNLKRTDGYLSPSTTHALTQIALQSVYKDYIINRFGQSTTILKDHIRRFQHDYKLQVDGKLGSNTRSVMFQVLTRLKPRPYRYPKLIKENDLATDDEIRSDSEVGVIGTDTRVPQLTTTHEPNRWVGRLQGHHHLTKVDQDPISGQVISQAIVTFADKFKGGTGTLISPRHILTNAHILSYRDSKKSVYAKAYKVAFSPGLNRAERKRYNRFPYGTLRGKSIDPYQLLNGWEVLSPTGIVIGFDHYHDIALIELSESAEFLSPKSHPSLGYWGIHSDFQIHKATENDVGKLISTIGYPTKKPKPTVKIRPNKKGMQWKGTGKITDAYGDKNSTDLHLFTHNADVSDGHSGAPIWIERVINGKIVNCMIAIDTLTHNTTKNKNKNENFAIALTESVLQEIQSWAPDTFRYEKGVLSVVKP